MGVDYYQTSQQHTERKYNRPKIKPSLLLMDSTDNNYIEPEQQQKQTNAQEIKQKHRDNYN